MQGINLQHGFANPGETIQIRRAVLSWIGPQAWASEGASSRLPRATATGEPSSNPADPIHWFDRYLYEKKCRLVAFKFALLLEFIRRTAANLAAKLLLFAVTLSSESTYAIVGRQRPDHASNRA
ncbi:MAG: hypothetical protein KDA41_15080 [Planctomycetales bacterium]|nr:hypothetical protein [Planctomycetales bacterium]